MPRLFEQHGHAVFLLYWAQRSCRSAWHVLSMLRPSRCWEPHFAEEILGQRNLTVCWMTAQPAGGSRRCYAERLRCSSCSSGMCCPVVTSLRTNTTVEAVRGISHIMAGPYKVHAVLAISRMPARCTFRLQLRCRCQTDVISESNVCRTSDTHWRTTWTAVRPSSRRRPSRRSF